MMSTSLASSGIHYSSEAWSSYGLNQKEKYFSRFLNFWRDMNLRILREGANVSLAMLSSNPWFHSPLHTYVVNQCRLVFLLDDFGFCFLPGTVWNYFAMVFIKRSNLWKNICCQIFSSGCTFTGSSPGLSTSSSMTSHMNLRAGLGNRYSSTLIHRAPNVLLADSIHSVYIYI